MKKMFSLLVLCLVVSLGSVVVAQQPSIRLSANSAPVTDGRIELKDQKRLQWFIDDSKPMNAGYAYEFGPVYLVAPNGQKTVLKAKEVMNGPVFRYSVSKFLFDQHPQGFVLEMDAITRYNPDHSTDKLVFDNKFVKLQIVPAQH